MNELPDVIPGDAVDDLLQAFRRGDAGASERLHALLVDPITRNVVKFLGRDAADVDDVIQESLISSMQYLAREVEYRGDPVKVAIVIALNRCRDIERWRHRRPQVDIDSLEGWIADPSRSVLDELEAADMKRMLQVALGRLSARCQELLTAYYVDGLDTEAVRRRIGLETVQGVYYRRAGCVREITKVFQELMLGRSGNVTTDDPPSRGGPDEE